MKIFLSHPFRCVLLLSLLLQVPLSLAEKTLTIVSPSGQKEITLDEDPEVIISYTPSGMKLNFTNINMKVICIEDPSTTGLCRLQAYDGGTVPGSLLNKPGAPGRPSAAAGDSSAALSWTAPTDNGGAEITGYLIEQAVSSGSPSFQPAVANTNSTATQYTVSGLNNGTAYVFRIAAINSAGTGNRGGYSDPVTPTSGSTPGGGSSAYANACSGLPSLVNCRKLFAGNLASGGSARPVGVTDNTVLSIPFMRETGTVPVAIGYQSFQSANNYFFDAWLSLTANGDILPGGNCNTSQPYAESQLNLTSQSGEGSGCTLPSGDGLVWLNFKYWNPYTGDIAGYTITTLTVADIQ